MANDLISQVKVGTITYDIKDAWARDHLQHPIQYLGKTTTPLVDGSTTNPIMVNGASVTAVSGDIVLTSDTHKEFIFDGSAWELFGDEGSYVVKGKYSTDATTSGSATSTVASVSIPIFTGDASTISITSKNASAVTGAVSEGGSGSNISWTYNTYAIDTASTVTKFSGLSSVVSGSVNYDKLSTIYTPGISTVTFSGTAASITVTASNQIAGVYEHTFTPSGTISKPAVTITPTNATVLKTASGTFVTSVTGTTAPIGSVTGEVLDLSYALMSLTAPTGNVSTTNETVTKSITAELAAAPEFTGDTLNIAHSFLRGNIVSNGTFTPSGTINLVLTAPTFTLTSTSTSIVNGTTTAQGEISVGLIATATTISKKLQATIAANAMTVSGSADYTPSGSVSAPTVTMNSHTHAVPSTTVDLS